MNQANEENSIRQYYLSILRQLQREQQNQYQEEDEERPAPNRLRDRRNQRARVRASDEWEDYRHRVEEGTSKDLFIGFVIGFLLYLLAILLIFFCNFNRRYKVGILWGFFLRFVLQLITATHAASS